MSLTALKFNERQFRKGCHLLLLIYLHQKRIQELKPFEAINIGTGSGTSVMQMVREFE